MGIQPILWFLARQRLENLLSGIAKVHWAQNAYRKPLDRKLLESDWGHEMGQLHEVELRKSNFNPIGACNCQSRLRSEVHMAVHWSRLGRVSDGAHTRLCLIWTWLLDFRLQIHDWTFSRQRKRPQEFETSITDSFSHLSHRRERRSTLPMTARRSTRHPSESRTHSLHSLGSFSLGFLATFP